MFTGIIEATSAITAIHSLGAGRTLTIERPRTFSTLKRGASIAVDGVCLTIQDVTARCMTFDCAPQTLKLTQLGYSGVGDRLNLERPLRGGQELGGHMISGHVDAVGIVQGVQHDNGYWLTVELQKALVRYCPVRGSIALNGVSLTIAQQKGRCVAVTLIPTTLKQTNLGLLQKGDKVNVEIDLIARYLQKFIQQDK